MRTILFIILFLSPVLGFSQTSYVFVKLTDARGAQIYGDATTRGFEKSIRALTINSSGKNNTQFNFTMPVTGAGAALKSAMANSENLLNANVWVMIANSSTGALQTSYTINMEKIRVLSCSETMGCNNAMSTAVVLNATRIGWTYYTPDKTGTNMVVSQKYGFDAETGGAWTKF